MIDPAFIIDRRNGPIMINMMNIIIHKQ